MVYSTLISPQELFSHLDDPDWAIVDCRFSLADPELGYQHYLEDHIPGAVYANLNTSLSAPVIPGQTGRHPLPSVDQTAQYFSSIGIDVDVQVVAYDDVGGALAAARVWWLLHWLGHTASAVLNGGWQACVKAGYPQQAGLERRLPRTFHPVPHPELLVDGDQVQALSQNPRYQIVDSRTPERFRGEREPIDPIAGRIPGAVNLPYLADLTPDQHFRPPEELRQLYRSTLGDLPAERIVFYCGSGVTAVHNILAMDYAGLGFPKLYAGSWSDWITNPDRPVEVG